MNRLLTVVGAIVIFACVSTGTSIAATGTRVGSSGISLHAAINPAGQYVVSWQDPSSLLPLRVLSGDNGTPPAPTQRLGYGFIENPSAAITPDGTRIVSWLAAKPGDDSPKYDVTPDPSVPTTALFGAPGAAPSVTALTPIPDFNGSELAQVAVGPDSSAMRVWSVGSNSDFQILSSTKPSGGEFQPAQTVFSAITPSGADDVSGDIAVGGRQTIVWSRMGKWCSPRVKRCTSIRPVIEYTDSDESGVYLPPSTVSGSSFCRKLAFDENDLGGAVLLMACASRRGETYRYATRLPGQPFSAARKLTNYEPDYLDMHQAAIALPDGRAVFAWSQIRRHNYSIQRIEGAAGVLGGVVGRTHALSPYVRTDRTSSFNDLAVPVPYLFAGPAGLAYLATRLKRDGKLRIGPIGADMKIGRSTPIGPAMFLQSVAVSDNGSGVAIWASGQSKRVGVRFSTFSVPVS